MSRRTLKVLILKGLPGSGKTKYAKELQAREPGRWKRVNKDDLRAMLDDGKWSKEREKFICEARDGLIRNALIAGFNVIVDDTNFEPKHEENIRVLAAEFVEPDLHVDVKVMLINASLGECIARDAARLNPVGEKVIREMYNRYLRQGDSVPEVKTVPYNPSLPNAIICDLDGTLALRGERSWFDWKKVGKDRINEPVALLLDQMRRKAEVILTSGRNEICRPETEDWLARNYVPWMDLYMRATDDNRGDEIVKREMYENHIKGRYNILFVLDDRDRVVKMWRELGLPCFQVNYGNF